MVAALKSETEVSSRSFTECGEGMLAGEFGGSGKKDYFEEDVIKLQTKQITEENESIYESTKSKEELKTEPEKL